MSNEKEPPKAIGNPIIQLKINRQEEIITN